MLSGRRPLVTRQVLNVSFHHGEGQRQLLAREVAAALDFVVAGEDFG